MLAKVTVKLNQPTSELIKVATGEFTARVTSAPENNKANLEVVKLLANHYKIPKSTITLVRGAKSKIKLFEL